MSEQTPAKRIFDFSLLKRVFSYAAPYRNKMIISVVLAIALAVISPVRPWLIQLTVDKYIEEDLVNAVIILTSIQLGLLLIETAMRFYFSFLTAWLGQTVVKDLRTAVYKKLYTLTCHSSTKHLSVHSQHAPLTTLKRSMIFFLKDSYQLLQTC